MKLKWIDQLLPAQDSPQSDTASGSEELPEVDSDSDEDPEEWEPELGPSADQPVAQSNQQQPECCIPRLLLLRNAWDKLK